MKNRSPLYLLVPLLFLAGCGGNPTADESAETASAPATPAVLDPMEDKGIGPIKSLTLGPIDEAMVAEGKKVYDAMCTACHKVEKRFIGPSPVGILDRRTPEWIMNMILNPDVMVKENAQARQLLAEYMAPMANQNLTEEQARAVLEYFRTLDELPNPQT